MVETIVVAGIVAVFTVTAAFGALFFKKGASEFSLSIDILKQLRGIIKNTNLLVGVFLYAAPTPVYLWALKNASLSLVYPITSLTYIWVSLLSMKFLRERMNRFKWLGISSIILGVSLLAYSTV
ncbi:EamA family transporter [Candidatus Woesearchaeota archaeon]|nr:EamA family transporter [Candidatus Woesearchaeota archaeon]